jgi:hypothetical protein
VLFGHAVDLPYEQQALFRPGYRSSRSAKRAANGSREVRTSLSRSSKVSLRPTTVMHRSGQGAFTQAIDTA